MGSTPFQSFRHVRGSAEQEMKKSKKIGRMNRLGREQFTRSKARFKRANVCRMMKGRERELEQRWHWQSEIYRCPAGVIGERWTGFRQLNATKQRVTIDGEGVGKKSDICHRVWRIRSNSLSHENPSLTSKRQQDTDETNWRTRSD